MKKNLSLVGALLAVLPLLTACDRMHEAKNTYSAIVTSTKAVKNMGAALEESVTKHKARAAHGDTLSMNYKDLEKYLPSQISGYTADGEPKGETMNMSGLSYSTCEQNYKKGDQNLKVQLVDYNGANALYTVATSMMSAGFSQENDEEVMRSCDLGVDGVKGWETLQKKDKKAAVALGVSDRFFVSVEADGQADTDFVKSIAKNVDLHALAKL